MDFWEVNKITKADRYPLPCIDSLIHGVEQNKVNYLLTMDLKAGFHQVSIAKRDQEKSAFIYPGGFFKWLFMPFGLRNMPSSKINGQSSQRNFKSWSRSLDRWFVTQVENLSMSLRSGYKGTWHSWEVSFDGKAWDMPFSEMFSQLPQIRGFWRRIITRKKENQSNWRISGAEKCSRNMLIFRTWKLF